MHDIDTSDLRPGQSVRPLWLTLWSDGHAPLFQQHFLRSWEAVGMSDDFVLRDQYVRWNEIYSGENQRFHDNYTAWIADVGRAFEDHPGRLIVASGCDFHFYRRPTGIINEALRMHDIAFVQDSRGPDGTLCTCLFAAYSTAVVRAFLRDWVSRASEIACGQIRCNVIAREYERAGLWSVARLPESCWTHGLISGEVWDGRNPERLPNPPTNIVLHHGNWTQGPANKLALLDEIERRVASFDRAS